MTVSQILHSKTDGPPLSADEPCGRDDAAQGESDSCSGDAARTAPLHLMLQTAGRSKSTRRMSWSGRRESFLLKIPSLQSIVSQNSQSSANFQPSVGSFVHPLHVSSGAGDDGALVRTSSGMLLRGPSVLRTTSGSARRSWFVGSTGGQNMSNADWSAAPSAKPGSHDLAPSGASSARSRLSDLMNPARSGSYKTPEDITIPSSRRRSRPGIGAVMSFGESRQLDHDEVSSIGDDASEMSSLVGGASAAGGGVRPNLSRPRSSVRSKLVQCLRSTKPMRPPVPEEPPDSDPDDDEYDYDDDYELLLEHPAIRKQDEANRKLLDEAQELMTKVNRSLEGMGKPSPFRPTLEIIPGLEDLHRNLKLQLIDQNATGVAPPKSKEEEAEDEAFPVPASLEDMYETCIGESSMSGAQLSNDLLPRSKDVAPPVSSKENEVCGADSNTDVAYHNEVEKTSQCSRVEVLEQATNMMGESPRREQESPEDDAPSSAPSKEFEGMDNAAVPVLKDWKEVAEYLAQQLAEVREQQAAAQGAGTPLLPPTVDPRDIRPSLVPNAAAGSGFAKQLMIRCNDEFAEDVQKCPFRNFPGERFSNFLANFVYYQPIPGDSSSVMRPTSLCHGTGTTTGMRFIDPEMMAVFDTFGSYLIGAFATFGCADNSSCSTHALELLEDFDDLVDEDHCVAQLNSDGENVVDCSEMEESPGSLSCREADPTDDDSNTHGTPPVFSSLVLATLQRAIDRIAGQPWRASAKDACEEEESLAPTADSSTNRTDPFKNLENSGAADGDRAEDGTGTSQAVQGLDSKPMSTCEPSCEPEASGPYESDSTASTEMAGSRPVRSSLNSSPEKIPTAHDQTNANIQQVAKAGNSEREKSGWFWGYAVQQEQHCKRDAEVCEDESTTRGDFFISGTKQPGQRTLREVLGLEEARY